MERHRRMIAMSYLLSIIVLISGCGTIQATPAGKTVPVSTGGTSKATATPTLPRPTATVTPTRVPPAKGEEISFITEDKLKIYGTIYRGDRDLAVVLAHQRDNFANQKSWRSFAQLLVSEGYTALTFDFRGVGKSQGDINYMENEVVRDTNAAIEFLWSQGFSRTVCIGSSLGGTACLETAVSYDLEGVVAIATPMSQGEPTKITIDDLKNLTMPKLFICTENDRFGRIVEHTQIMYDNSPEPKQIKFFPGTVHGTELFFTEHKDAFRQLLLDFVKGLG